MKPIARVASWAVGLALLQGCAAGVVSAADDAPGEAQLAGAQKRAAAAPQGQGAPAPSAPVAQSSSLDQTIATVNGRDISLRQLMTPLIEAHGLPVLLNVVQLEMAKQDADRAGIVVTEDDFRAEREQTVRMMFAEADQKAQEKIDDAIAKKDFEEAEKLKEQMRKDQDQMLDQFLAQQKVTRPEFELVMKTNTYLRKIAEPRVSGQIKEEHLRKAFETEYGASVRVRHIQGSPHELAQALSRVRAGEPFEVVAREVSRNQHTAPMGGELPRFSLSTAGLPQNFKQTAFDLAVGEVSSMVEADGAYHIIKLEEKFQPKAVKFESVKEIISANLRERAVQLAVKQLRDRLAARARADLKIQEPILRDQFAEKLAERNREIKDQQELNKQLEKERAREAEEAKKLSNAPAAPDAPAAPKKPVAPKTPAPAPADGQPAEVPAPPARK